VKYTSRWEMPEVTFYQVEDHGFPQHEGKPLYCYGKPGETNDNGIPKTGELFLELDRALVAWVGEKYTGPRGAGGTGVGTAADWFMQMIGADEVVPVDRGRSKKALQEIIVATARFDGPIYRRADAMETELAKRGLVLARMNNGS